MNIPSPYQCSAPSTASFSPLFSIPREEEDRIQAEELAQKMKEVSVSTSATSIFIVLYCYTMYIGFQQYSDIYQRTSADTAIFLSLVLYGDSAQWKLFCRLAVMFTKGPTVAYHGNLSPLGL